METFDTNAFTLTTGAKFYTYYYMEDEISECIPLSNR